MTNFVNEPVDVTGLPVLDEEAFVSVHPKYLPASLLGRLIFAVVVVAITIIAALMVEQPRLPLLIGGAILLLTALAAVLTTVEVHHLGYQVRQHDLSFRNGVLVRETSTLPFIRVQHARIRQSFVERSFGIATLHVNSAGPDLIIPGLALADAERLKALVVERAGELVEDA